MFAAALREEAHRELISVEGSSASRQARVQEELVRARHGEEQSAGLWRIEMANARAQAAAEQEAAVARCRSSAAAALDNARAHAENRCERLEEGFVRERDRAAVAELVLADRGAQLREEQAMVSEFQDTALGMQAQVDEFVEQYAESTKRVIDRECSDVKKHERDLVENAEALAWHEESVVTELRLAEEHEDILDDVAFADGAWNENAAVFEQKDPLDTVLALDADDAAPDDEVVKEAEAAAVEGEAVDFPEVDADRKDEATLRDAVAEEVLAPAGENTSDRVAC